MCFNSEEENAREPDISLHVIALVKGDLHENERVTALQERRKGEGMMTTTTSTLLVIVNDCDNVQNGEN